MTRACVRHQELDCPSCRGRANKYRGDSIEREACRLLGVKRVGQRLGKVDGGEADEWINVQVKSGGTYPERIDRWLRELPKEPFRAVVMADAPGPGRKRRWIIAFDLQEWLEWTG